jgi:hypothetical protein
MKYDIEQFEPCNEAVEYYKNYNSFEDAWNDCPRGDWMLCIASKIKVDKRLLVKCAGRCAATVKHLMEDQGSLDALQACEDYGNGIIDDDMLDVAAYAAAAYAADAAASAAAYADASAAAYAYSAANNKKQNQQQTAYICRELLTDEVFKIINQ